MSENAAAGSIARTKMAVSLFVGFALLLLLIANGHLIYVATTITTRVRRTRSARRRDCAAGPIQRCTIRMLAVMKW